jgi:hypothetical protein
MTPIPLCKTCRHFRAHATQSGLRAGLCAWRENEQDPEPDPLPLARDMRAEEEPCGPDATKWGAK